MSKYSKQINKQQTDLASVSVLKFVDGSLESELPSRDCLLFYPESPDPSVGPYAIRCGQYKAHVYTRGNDLSDHDNPDTRCRGSAKLTHHSPPLLYNLNDDPGKNKKVS